MCPDVLSRMLARHAILLSPTDAAKAYTKLFPTAEAAKKALQRAKPGRDFGDIPLGESLLGRCPRSRLVRVSYRPAGSGQQRRAAFVPEEHLPTFQGWLEARFGRLAHYALDSSQPVLSAPQASTASVSSVLVAPVATPRLAKGREAIILFFKPKLSAAQAMNLKKLGVVSLVTHDAVAGHPLTTRSGLSQRNKDRAQGGNGWIENASLKERDCLGSGIRPVTDALLG